MLTPASRQAGMSASINFGYMNDLTINSDITIPESALTFKFSRSGGKGGQNVNKVATKVEITVHIGNVVAPDAIKLRIEQNLSRRLDSFGLLHVVSQESRSQWQNKQIALKKLADMIAEASLEEKERVATRPTNSSRKKRLERKKIHSKRKATRRTKHFDEE